jgi:hypothetical protein
MDLMDMHRMQFISSIYGRVRGVPSEVPEASETGLTDFP